MQILHLLIIQVFCGILMFFMPNDLKKLNFMHIILNLINSIFILYFVYLVIKNGTISEFNEILAIDSIGAIFLILIAITGFFTNLYSTSYLKWQLEKGTFTIKRIRHYYSLSYIFVFTMTLSCVVNNMALLWAAVEATTLASVFLVAINNDKKSTESGYKYIVLCSIGLAFALFATVLLYSSSYHSFSLSSDAMLFSKLLDNASNLNKDALKLVFIFALIGYGTKAGLVPTHTWLPDVHAQGPAPTSSLLSGILLKCAMLALIRFYAIVGNAVGFDFVQDVMIISGILTLFVSGYFLITQHDVKRMFAYHSIVHMGVIAVGLGIGSFLGVFAALFHCLAHSFTKALAFCVTGNIERIYGTKDMFKMGGMVYIAPVTTVLFGISICSLVGVPGFAIFFSEFNIFKAGIMSGQYLSIVLFAIALLVIFIADFSHFFLSSFGKVVGEVKHNKEMTFIENLPLIALAILIILFGIYNFSSFTYLLDESARIITGGKI